MHSLNQARSRRASTFLPQTIHPHTTIATPSTTQGGCAVTFPFGYGLSYTTFASSELTLDGLNAKFTITNTGSRAGADVGQLYLVSRNGIRKQRLVGFARAELEPGASKQVTLKIDRRLLADWKNDGWELPGGEYAFALGENAEALSSAVSRVKLKHDRWKN
jgi:beta-glucosidase